MKASASLQASASRPRAGCNGPVSLGPGCLGGPLLDYSHGEARAGLRKNTWLLSRPEGSKVASSLFSLMMQVARARMA